MAHSSPPITRAPAGHLLAKPSQRPRLRIPEEALWPSAEVGEGKEGCLGENLTYTNSLKMILLGGMVSLWRADLGM